MEFLAGGEDLLGLLLGRGGVSKGGEEREDLTKEIPWLDYPSILLTSRMKEIRYNEEGKILAVFADTSQ